MNLEKVSAKTVNKLFGILCLIPCINILVSVIVSFFYFVSIVFKFNISSFYIQLVIPQFLFPIITLTVFLIFKKVLKIKEVEYSDYNKNLSVKETILLIFIFLGSIILLELLSILNSMFFYAIGIDLPALSIERFMPSSTIEIILFIFVIAVLPAISEETIYRFGVCGSLSRYSVFGSIVVSSLAFGIMHGTLQQLVYAIAAGFVLGYVFLKTENIKITVFLHFLTNFISCVYMLIEMRYGTEAYITTHLIFAGFSLLIGFISAVIYFKIYGFSIKKSDNLPAGKVILLIFRSPFFYLFTFIEIGFMVLNLL